MELQDHGLPGFVMPVVERQFNIETELASHLLASILTVHIIVILIRLKPWNVLLAAARVSLPNSAYHILPDYRTTNSD